MYMSQHIFTPVPSKFQSWVPYNRNYMSLLGRAPGAILNRCLREVRLPEQFYAIGLWTSRDVAKAWAESADSLLGAKPNVDQGLYDGYPMTWSRWDLVDFAWGLEGPAALGAGKFAKVITWAITPEMRPAQDALNRAVLSLLARQPGFVLGETYRGHRGDRYQIIYTFKDATDWPFGADGPPDLRMMLEADTYRSVREKTAKPELLDCTLWECVLGPEQEQIVEMVRGRSAATAL
jgi:hypothetical protein